MMLTRDGCNAIGQPGCQANDLRTAADPDIPNQLPRPQIGYHQRVTQVLLATDSDSVHSAVDAALGSDKTDIARVRTGVEVRAAVREQQPDVVICDLQIGNMGGMATCLDLRLEAEMGRVPETRVLMLLDREADAYLAKQSRADGWLVKPLDAVSVQRAVLAVLS